MSGQILVALKRNEQMEEIIPYIEKIAQPGMKVVFLFPYPVTGDFAWLGDHWITTESPRKAMLEGRAIMEKYSWELQRGLAEQRASGAREALLRKGIELEVEVYAGSLRRVVREHAATEDVHLVMMPAGSSYPVIRLLRRMAPLAGLFRKPGFHPVLLFCPRQV